MNIIDYMNIIRFYRAFFVVHLQFTGKKVDIYSEDHGLIFKSFLYLFKVLQEKKECHFILKASFLEIYNEKVSERKQV